MSALEDRVRELADSLVAQADRSDAWRREAGRVTNGQSFGEAARRARNETRRKIAKYLTEILEEQS